MTIIILYLIVSYLTGFGLFVSLWRDPEFPKEVTIFAFFFSPVSVPIIIGLKLNP